MENFFLAREFRFLIYSPGKDSALSRGQRCLTTATRDHTSGASGVIRPPSVPSCEGHCTPFFTLLREKLKTGFFFRTTDFGIPHHGMFFFAALCEGFFPLRASCIRPLWKPPIAAESVFVRPEEPRAP